MTVSRAAPVAAAALAAQQTEWRRVRGGVHAVLGWAAQTVWPPVVRPAQRYDPGNVFRRTHNIRPAGAVGA